LRVTSRGLGDVYKRQIPKLASMPPDAAAPVAAVPVAAASAPPLRFFIIYIL
jgi:hypothetical protein